jgi:hypothetical protein
VRLHPENETRVLSLSVTDTQEQTHAVLAALAKGANGSAPNLEGWCALQEWLGLAERRVTIPYSAELAERVPPISVRLRRDFEAILNLIRAHATLHQTSRERDTEGRIIATLEDYAAVRELVSDLVSEGVGATVSPDMRQTVEAVARLCAAGNGKAKNNDLARELKLDKSSASRRARKAKEQGYLLNLEPSKGKPKRLVPGNPLPDDIEILPTSGELSRALRGCSAVGGEARSPSWGGRSDTPHGHHRVGAPSVSPGARVVRPGRQGTATRAPFLTGDSLAVVIA